MFDGSSLEERTTHKNSEPSVSLEVLSISVDYFNNKWIGTSFRIKSFIMEETFKILNTNSGKNFLQIKLEK